MPADIRRRDAFSSRADPIARAYERVCFDKAHTHVEGRPLATFVAPGQPLLVGNVTVRIEIEADIPDGVPDDIARIVTENANSLKFTSAGFEVE